MLRLAWAISASSRLLSWLCGFFVSASLAGDDRVARHSPAICNNEHATQQQSQRLQPSEVSTLHREYPQSSKYAGALFTAGQRLMVSDCAVPLKHWRQVAFHTLAPVHTVHPLWGVSATEPATRANCVQPVMPNHRRLGCVRYCRTLEAGAPGRLHTLLSIQSFHAVSSPHHIPKTRAFEPATSCSRSQGPVGMDLRRALPRSAAQGSIKSSNSRRTS